MRNALLGMGLLAACGGSSDEVNNLLAPPAPGEGVQYYMVTEIPAGTEAEHCMFVQAPPEGLLVNSDEVRFTSGSHHFLLYETSYNEIPTQNEDNEIVDTSGVFDCTEGATDGWNVTKLIGGSQNGDGDSMLAFPDDVALRVRPNAVLLMNAHYINPADQPLTPEVRINLNTIDEDELSEEGDLLFLYNPFIRVPSMGTGRARWQCPVNTDITITNIQSHMHARGNDYSARVVGDDEPFYATDQWEDVPVQVYSPGLQVTAGSVLDYQCDYVNGEARNVFQGPKSTDEMCMLIGSFYPADSNTANCQDADGNLAGTWIGNGTATCAASWSCLQSNFSLEAGSACIDDSDPAVGDELSAVITCAIRENLNLAACQTEIDVCNGM